MGIKVAKSHLLRLNSRRLVKVKSAKGAEKLLQAYCDNGKRERGYRLRFVPHYETGCIELSDDRQLNVEMAVKLLKNAGLYVKDMLWKDHDVLKQTFGRRDGKGPGGLL